MRIALLSALTLMFCGALVGATGFSPAPVGHDLTITPMGGDVTVTPFAGGAPVALHDATTLRDQDIVRTEAAGRAAITGAPGWSATLDKSSACAVRTLPEKEGNLTVFRRALEVLAGTVTWKATSDSVLLLPGARLRARAVQVRIYYYGGQINVEASDGSATLEVQGSTTIATLTNGQKLQIQFNPATNQFRIEVFEDNGEAIEILLGTTVLLVTKGDIFLARVDGTNLDVTVVRGLIQVTGPDGKTEDVGQGTILTVVAGGVGAAQGANGNVNGGGPGGGRHPRVPKEPHRNPMHDRSDVSPSGIK